MPLDFSGLLPAPANSPAPKNETMVQHLLRNIGQGNKNVEHQWFDFKRSMANAASTGNNVMQAAGGVLQRGVHGALAADDRAGGLGKAKPIDRLGQAAYNMAHPFDKQTVADDSKRAEHVVGFDEMVKHMEQKLGVSESDPRFRGKVAAFVHDMGWQTLSDPLTYFGATGLSRRAGSKMLEWLGEGMSKAVRSPHAGISTAAAVLVPSPGLRKTLNAKGQAHVEQITSWGHQQEHKVAVMHSGMVKAEKAKIEAGQLSPAMKAHSKLDNSDLVHLGAKERVAKVEESLLKNRLDSRKRQIHNRIARETGLGQGALFDQQKAAQHIAKPNAQTTDYSEAMGAIEKHVEGGGNGVTIPGTDKKFKGLAGLSNIQRDVLTSQTALPHGKNISTLAFLAGGAPGLAKGMFYTLRGVPKHLRDRLENGGAMAEFGGDVGKLSPVRVVPYAVRDWLSYKPLNRLDLGIRAARLEQVDKQFGNKLSELEKTKKVDLDIGPYHNSPAYVKFLRFLGGNFPQWHSYVVPTTTARAVLENPHRVMFALRGEENFSNDIFQPTTGVGLHMGGPVDEAASAATDPERAMVGEKMKYFLGPSDVLGPLNHLLGGGYKPDLGGSLASTAEGILQPFIPYNNILLPLAGYNPTNSNASGVVRAASSAFGSYTTNPPKPGDWNGRVLDYQQQQAEQGNFVTRDQAERKLSGQERSFSKGRHMFGI